MPRTSEELDVVLGSDGSCPICKALLGTPCDAGLHG
jgi:hypothetical protein